jgi:predicted DNA binding CopG/RHH family protein
LKTLRTLSLRVRQSFPLAVKKLSTMKSIPYQALIRHWLAEGLKHEMDSVLK